MTALDFIEIAVVIIWFYILYAIYRWNKIKVQEENEPALESIDWAKFEENPELIAAKQKLNMCGVAGSEAEGLALRLQQLCTDYGCELNDLVITVGNASNKGTLQSEEFYQLLNMSLPIVVPLAERINCSSPALFELVRYDQVSFQEFRDAIFSLTDPNSRFHRVFKPPRDIINEVLTEEVSR